MLLLNEPYGYGAGAHISLRAIGLFDKQQLIAVLESYSCYPPAIPKIVNCLTYSARYDCVVQRSWFKSQSYLLAEELLTNNIVLELL